MISLIALVSAVDLTGTTGIWTDADGNDITGNTLGFTIGGIGSEPVNKMVVNDLIGVSQFDDYVVYELWEKDTLEGSADDFIRQIYGTFVEGSPAGTGYTTGDWTPNLADIAAGGGEADNIYEFFYKMSIGPHQQCTEGGCASQIYYNTILNIDMEWPGSFPNPVVYWMDYDQIHITERNLNSADLSNTNKPRLTNVVFPVVEGINIPESVGEGENIPVTFSIKVS